MINLITILSTGCFDALNVPGNTYVYENDEGELIVKHVTETEYMINTMTYCLTTKDEINGVVAYLKQLLKTSDIFVYKEHTSKIIKIL